MYVGRMLIALACCAVICGRTLGGDQSPPKVIGARRLEDTIARLGGDGDNWHMTWLSDDRVVAGLCDGNARPWPHVPHRSFNSRLISIRGVPPQLDFSDVPGYPELLGSPEPPIFSRYYGFGILAVDGKIYQFLSTFNRPIDAPQPSLKFVGAKLIFSPDNGVTWYNQDGSTPVRWERLDVRSQKNLAFFNEPDDAFSLLTMLQMGRNYEQNQDGYVYIYSPSGNTEEAMNKLALACVPKDQVLDRKAYEFFVTRLPDGAADWTSDIAKRGAVYTFPTGWVNTQAHPYAWHPSVVYNKPLGVYLMANWGMGCAPDGSWFGKPSYLGFWTAPHPWGPWTQIHEETEWIPGGDKNARCYQPQIGSKWIAADGKSFWLVWTDFQVLPGGRQYYSFNTQRVELQTDGS